MSEERAGTCPECGSDLTTRTNRATGQDFTGCKRYPDCRYTAPLTAYQELKRAGAPTLPGLEEC